HTVGPIWQGGSYGEAGILASCYRCTLRVADQLGASSVAFPAIATGVYGFPSRQAAQIAVETIRSTPTAGKKGTDRALQQAGPGRLGRGGQTAPPAQSSWPSPEPADSNGGLMPICDIRVADGRRT